jgi:hypothetical protein
MISHLRAKRKSWALPLILCALFLRFAIPSGWMPSVDGAGAIRISICSGMGIQEAWMDADGTLHKSEPGKQQQSDSPCVFSALGTAFSLPQLISIDGPLALISTAAPIIFEIVSLGRGLAAPPPPSTGPPSLT